MRGYNCLSQLLTCHWPKQVTGPSSESRGGSNHKVHWEHTDTGRYETWGDYRSQPTFTCPLCPPWLRTLSHIVTEEAPPSSGFSHQVKVPVGVKTLLFTAPAEGTKPKPVASVGLYFRLYSLPPPHSKVKQYSGYLLLSNKLPHNLVAENNHHFIS